jgi:single-strand DNA-binding protein
MQTIVGRLTANAEVAHLDGEKTVVNFTVVVNDYYKPKGSEELKQEATYFECAYWRNAQITEKLTKGSIVEVSGRLGARGYIDSKSDVKAAITLRVDTIKIHHRATPDQQETEELPEVSDFNQG